jgi:hypothetical protein
VLEEANLKTTQKSDPVIDPNLDRAPVIVLGVSRSGTSLLKQMLNHHSEVAIPSESYFIPQLRDRYRRLPNTELLLADLMCCFRVREWGIGLADLQRHVPDNAGFSEVIQEVYRSYAEAHGKHRFGDKTPLYMQHLDLLEQVFPGAQYVHIVRDGRNAALSYECMPYRSRFNLLYPRGISDFAFCWRREILSARRFGSTVAAGRYFEVRYESLVTEPEARLREVCSFLGLRFESAMLEYYRNSTSKPDRNHKRLAEPPSPGLTDWRKQMRAVDLARFEAIAGDLLDILGYERAFPNPSAWVRTKAWFHCMTSHGRLISARLVMPIFHRSPLWRWRQNQILRARGLSN